MKRFFELLYKASQKPPKIVYHRAKQELGAILDRKFCRRYHNGFPVKQLLKAGKAKSIDDLWEKLAARPYFTYIEKFNSQDYEKNFPTDISRIFSQSEKALVNTIELLGSQETNLGEKIAWNCDFKVNKQWPNQFMRDIEYSNLDLPSDVKVPWDLSRLQWLQCLGQAYLLTGEENYAEKVKNTIVSWIDDNPYAYSVNWSCTMEAAMRIFTWTWFFHVFAQSKSWQDQSFREKFLGSLYLHGRFTYQYIELSDLNGNHLTADAAALVVAGLFWPSGNREIESWQSFGWNLLVEEIEKQVYPDGVDFEASVPYHRLVTELFLYPALYRQQHKLEIPPVYQQRLQNMARFAQAYSKPDGSSPLQGDADDARTLALGGQQLGDHRYLGGIIGIAFNNQELQQQFSGNRSEVFWVVGPKALELPSQPQPKKSETFPHGGIYVMQNEETHLFIDCGPIGLGGRGGHGHNDCLAFELYLQGMHILRDCGSYVYTANAKERNLFRSTAYHNTPQVDNQEINRFFGPLVLWTMQYDATPKLMRWETTEQYDIFQGTHAGYERLSSPVYPIRTIVWDKSNAIVFVHDKIESQTQHDVAIRFHLSPDIEITKQNESYQLSNTSGQNAQLQFHASDWQFQVEETRISFSYGTFKKSKQLVCTTSQQVPELLTIFAPMDLNFSAREEWAQIVSSQNISFTR